MVLPMVLECSARNSTPKLAVKVFPLVTLKTVEVVERSVKEGVKGMKNNAIEHVRNKIIHSPRIANNAVAVA
ncbi:hypothetical protein QL285_018888 [Trifolium repens]|nr:hypothetical protein QL285_018888 [Trifolium repens]